MLEAGLDAEKLMLRWIRRALPAAVVVGALAALPAPPTLAVVCSVAFSGGAGTSGNPYLVSAKAQLTGLAGDANCWTYHFALTASIDVSGSGWTPIGNAVTPFSGGFDGRSFAISGVTITAGTIAGLFGRIEGTLGSGVVVKDLTVSGASISRTTGATGILAGQAGYATISGITTSGSVSTSGNGAGGAVGQLGLAGKSATLSSSSSSATVQGSAANVGGLVGEADGSISSSSASGSVTSTAAGSANVGGLVGSSSSTISSGTASGSVAAAGGNVGGLVGLSTGSITQGGATGTVTSSGAGAVNVGGLVGFANMSAGIVRCYATGQVNGTSAVGGLIGKVSQASISDSFASGGVTGTSDVGGLIGVDSDPAVGSVTRAYAKGAVNATGGTAGGLIAAGVGTVSDSYWDTVASNQSGSPGGGTGRTTAQLQQESTFTGWTITSTVSAGSTWGICAALNAGTPFLQWIAVNQGWSCTPSSGSGPIPLPVIQQIARPATGTCAQAAPATLNWAGVGSGGWSESWAQWPNGGQGGPVCTRTLQYSAIAGRWVVDPG